MKMINLIAILVGWICFIGLLFFVTYYLQKRNYYLGVGYYSTFGLIFFFGTCFFNLASM